MLVYSLAQIEHTVNGQRVVVEPKVVFDLDDDQVKRLTRLRAVRPASEEELALYEKQNSSKKSPTGPKVSEKPAVKDHAEGDDSDAPKKGRRARKVADL